MNIQRRVRLTRPVVHEGHYYDIGTVLWVRWRPARRMRVQGACLYESPLTIVLTAR